MFAMLSTAWVVPGIIGPTIAAVVGEVTSWRWVFLGLLPLLLVAGGVALQALRRVEGPPPGAADAGHGPGARLVRAVAAAAGAGLLVAALGATEPWVVVAGAVAGAAILLPAFRSLTPPGTLRLAVGVPAAVLLRAVMTFAFFASDAYIPLLLQTWRGTPAYLTGIVFTATTIAWTAGTWYQARHIDRRGPRFFVALGFTGIAIGAALTLPAMLPSVPAEITILTWILPGLGMGFMYSAVTLVVLRGVAQAEQGTASSSIQLADILGTALGAGIAGAITAAGVRAGGDGLGWALAAVFAMSLVVSLFGLAGSRRLGPAAPSLAGQPAAVD
jgi:MFS family permease